MKFELPILKETNDFLIISKPFGLSVHNEDQNQTSVLQILGPHLHLAHRLDKETSGILLIAKSRLAAKALMSTLQEKSSKKIYRAILRGNLTKFLTLKDDLKWTYPLSDKAEGRQNPQGKITDQVSAETKIKILKNNDYFTDVEAQIITGRQHQIRKHAALSGHAVVGDSRYNDKSYNQKIFKLYKFDRMLLHAEQLHFEYKNELIYIRVEVTESWDKMV